MTNLKLYKDQSQGFTLLELLIVVAIIGVLSVALVMILNPGEMLKKSRDAQRISDLTALKKAVEIYKTNIPNAKLAGVDNVGCKGTTISTVWQPATDHIYYSLPTETGTITATVLDGTTFTTGGGIQQVAKSSLGKVDGNGWLPIDFSSLSGGSPISALPIDPVNTISSLSAPTNTDLVYRYICSEKDQSFEIDATLESIAYTSTDNKMSKDGGNNDSYYEVGTGLKLFSGDLILNVGVPYQGGIIGYIYQVGDPGYVAGATHGLIAATSDQGSSIVWGCDGSNLTGANGTALGTGYQNTNDIISGCATLGIAARVARAYNGGGYSDWSLPSLDELDKFSLNRASIGNFGPYPYLASSETGDGLYSWYVHFGFGTVFNALASKNNPVFYVRAVRSF